MNGFLEHPGADGPIGAMMDEYARAAEELCLVAEAFEAQRFSAERASDDPDTTSPRTVGAHAVGAAWGYANYLRHAQGIEMGSAAVRPDDSVRTSTDLRPALEEAIRFTEQSVVPLRAKSEDELAKMEWRVNWGPLYNPESMLEHAICHLLRHRRQLERW